MRFEVELNSELKIEDPRGHSPETLRRLREALSLGASATPDAQRLNLFEIEAGEQVFYIHVSPLTRNITLLATWTREPELEPVHCA
jgi:hypothetical protein